MEPDEELVDLEENIETVRETYREWVESSEVDSDGGEIPLEVVDAGFEQMRGGPSLMERVDEKLTDIGEGTDEDYEMFLENRVLKASFRHGKY